MKRRIFRHHELYFLYGGDRHGIGHLSPTEHPVGFLEGDFTDLQLLGLLGTGPVLGKPSGQVDDPLFIGHRIGKVDPEDLLPQDSLQPGLFQQFPLRRVQGICPQGTAALGYLPAIAVQRETVLPHQVYRPLLIQRYDSDRKVLEMHLAVYAPAAAGIHDLVFRKADPGVIVPEGSLQNSPGISRWVECHRAGFKILFP